MLVYSSEFPPKEPMAVLTADVITTDFFSDMNRLITFYFNLYQCHIKTL